VGKRLQVDTDGLEGDGRDLAAIDTVHPKEEQCPAPGYDRVSTSMAFAMSAIDEGYVQRIREGKEVREHGGAIVTASGVMFEVADQHGSLMIDRVEVLGAPRPVGASPPSINQPRQPETHVLPSVPRIDAQSMDAESFSDAVHSGQGPFVVRDWGEQFGRDTDFLEYDADSTKRIADSIQEHWRDADSNAAPNVRTHGVWLEAVSQWAKKIGTSAGSIASAFEVVQRDTPTPTQLAVAKHALQVSAVLGPAAALVAYMNYESLKNKAIEAGARYQMSVENAVKDANDPVSAPPLIAKRAAIPPELVKGPGTWVTASRRDGNWQDYEQQVTGYPAGMEYEVPRASGDPVEFDGFDPNAGPNGMLIDAKGKGYEWMVGPNGEFKPEIKGVQQLQGELLRQYQASLASGVPVEWRAADPRVAEAMRALIEDGGYGDRIHVVVVPPT